MSTSCGASVPDLVKLNVGGERYVTSRSTLCRYPESMLGAMFSGQFTPACDGEDHMFIDRDGKLFIYILNFLRSGVLALPKNFKHLDQLCLEADFYQIQPLIRELTTAKQRHQETKIDSGDLVEIIEVRTGATATMPTSNSRVKTIISGRCEVVCSFPICNKEKLQHVNDKEFVELELSRTNSNIRLKLGEYLQNTGWKMVASDVTSSSGYDARSQNGNLMIEQTFRDRWFLQGQGNSVDSVNVFADCNGEI